MDKKNILVVGGGGREHAIIHTLKKSKSVGKIYAAPGNAGISALAECVPISATDIPSLVKFVLANPDIYMTVIGPDDTLALGLADQLLAHKKRVFGPTMAAAKIESSKSFAKEFMQSNQIPTASHASFDDINKALLHTQNHPTPIVVKADGLALGKGVFICQTKQEAQQAIKSIMGENQFGVAGKKIVIEEFVKGFWVTVLCFCDGKSIVPMVTARDYKPVFDGDLGPNTGGMGCFSPHPQFCDRLLKKAKAQIFEPTVKGLNKIGTPFKGVIYFDIMVDNMGDKDTFDAKKIENAKFNVIEYNARFGDPETQVVLSRLKTDLFDIFESVIDGNLDKIDFEWDKNSAVCVVAASGGYPNAIEKGKKIEIGKIDDQTIIFEAGTAFDGDGNKVTSGGRVLSVVCKGGSIKEARQKAYGQIKNVQFDKMFYRNDIAKDY